MENKEELYDIEFRSEEVQEILSKPPTKILLIGYLIFIFTIITIIFSYKKFQFGSSNFDMAVEMAKPPQTVLSPLDGVIEKVYVENNQLVKSGQKILLLDTILVKANVEGKINFQNFISEKQFIRKKDQILTIQPVYNFLKGGVIFINKEFKSHVKLNDVLIFNISHYGSVSFKGRVRSISQIPNNEGLYYTELSIENLKIDNNLLSLIRNNKIQIQIKY